MFLYVARWNFAYKMICISYMLLHSVDVLWYIFSSTFGKIFLIVTHEGAVRMSSFYVSMVKDYKDTLQLLAI